MSSKKKEEKKKKEEPEKKEKKEKKEHKEEKEEKEEKQKAKKEDEKDEELIIDTKGKPVRLEPGGKLLFQATEVKDMKKPSQFSIEVHFDQGPPVYKSKAPSNGLNFHLEDQMQNLDVPPDAKQMTVILKEKGLVGLNYKGEVRLELETLYDSYPYHQWFELKCKEGKDKKVNGALMLKVQYIGKNEPVMEVFKYPLHALINLNRLDIFQRKIEDLKLTNYTPNEKKLTPLLHAAAEGKVGFVKILIENKADPLHELAPENRTAIHLAAIGGHIDVIRYLSTVTGVDMNALDNSDGHQTPLHLAAENDKADAVHWLIKCGADVNAKNNKGNTALSHVLLMQPTSAPAAITALIERGADVYVTNNEGHAVWDIAQKKDMCYVARARTAFMNATDTVDAREFLIMQYSARKQRFNGKNMTKDWNTSTQFIITVDEPTKVSILAYSMERCDNCEKLVAFCLVQGSERKYRMPSFQQDGIGFGSSKAFECELLPKHAYTAITYCTDDSVVGDFGLCIFTKKGSKPVNVIEAEKWPHEAKATGHWKDDTAGGSADDVMNNLKFNLKNKDKKTATVLVMLRQVNKSIDALVIADGGHRITPSKYYVGFFVFDENLSKEIDKTDKWINSYDVYKYLELEAGQTVVIIPTTQKEGEEMEYELHAFSVSKVELKKLEEE